MTIAKKSIVVSPPDKPPLGLSISSSSTTMFFCPDYDDDDENQDDIDEYAVDDDDANVDCDYNDDNDVSLLLVHQNVFLP